jgi:hypothetical protein
MKQNSLWLLIILLSTNILGQTVVDWNTNNIAVGNFVPNNSPGASVTITGTNFSNLQGTTPRYNTGYSGYSNWALNGLGIAADFPNTTNSIVVDIVLSNPSCGDLQFSVHDLDGSTSGYIFEDKIVIDTWDQNNNAIAANTTNFVFGNSPFCGGPLFPGGNNLANSRIGRCENGASNLNSYGSVGQSILVTLKSPTTKIGRVRITYSCAKGASPDVNAFYTGTNPGFQNIVIGNLTLIPTILTPPAISGNLFICPGGSTNLTASGFSSYNWSTGASTGSISVSPVSTTNYIVTGTNAAGCSAQNNVNVTVLPQPAVAPTVSSASICSGQSINLAANPNINTSITTFNFEGANQFNFVNLGSISWRYGSFTKCNGNQAIYIGTGTTNNNYTTNQASVDFAYIDIPITKCNANLSFNWKCAGKSTDHLSVWIVPTTTTLTAGTALTSSATILKIGGDYWGQGSSCNSVDNINLIQGWVTNGQTIRLVFQARNSSSATVVNPAPMIDDVVITQFDNYTYSWSSTNTAYTSTNANGSESPTTSTTYNLLTTDCYGCTRSSALLVDVDPCGLPIELTSFTGSCAGRTKTFNWTTASETNNDFFTLERSTDGETFETVKIIPGAGTSTSSHHYSVQIAEADANLVYYRLKQTDYDGQFSYSNIIHLSCTSDNNYADELTVYPNPANESIQIQLHSNEQGTYVIAIYNLLGQVVQEVQHTKSGAETLSIPLTVANGQYVVCVTELNSGKTFNPVKIQVITK